MVGSLIQKAPGTRAILSRSPQIIDEDSLDIREDHNERPLGARESACIWRHTALDGVELFQGSYRTYEFAHHFHPVPAIGVVDNGAMSSYCRSATHVLPTGTVILLNPGEVHAPGPADSSGWSFRVFFFEESFFQARSAIFSPAALRFSKPFVQDRLLARSLLLLHRKLGDEGTALELESSLLAVFAQLAQRHACGSTRIFPSGTEKAKVNRVKDYLTASYGENITLDDLAKVAQFSPYHLLRTFRSVVGLTPHAYLAQLRIEAAKRLLRMGTAISEVAGRTGFTDQSHFTRQFKRITGVTPGQYLPQLRTRNG